jgi:hypothetical protein
MGARVEVSKEFDFALEVVGHGTLFIETRSQEGGRTFDEYGTRGTQEGVGPAYLYSLRQALVRWLEMPGHDPKLRVIVNLSDVPEQDLFLADTVYDSPSLVLDGGRLLVRVSTVPSTLPDPAAIRRLFAPFLTQHKAKCDDVIVEWKSNPFQRDDYPQAEVIIDWPTKGRTVADAWEFGEEAHALLWAADGGELTQSNALGLLRGGRWDLFRGQPESEWLEAKGEPYDHLIENLGENWRYELAKDVAAFANSPEGGIIVLGMITKNKGDGDVIRGYKEFKLRRVKRQAYRNHVAQLVYPRLTGFEVESIEGSRKGHGLAVLSIPPQPVSSRPFFVQGVLSRGKVLGGHVLLPVRREDDTALMDAGALHARIRLGEQVITGEKQSRSNR